MCEGCSAAEGLSMEGKIEALMLAEQREKKLEKEKCLQEKHAGKAYFVPTLSSVSPTV